MPAPPATLTTTTTLSALLEESWSRGFHTKANWKRVVTRNFIEPETIGQGYGNQINMGVVLTGTANSIAGTVDADPTSLTYEADTEQNVTVDPTRIYGALAFQPSSLSRFMRSESYRKAKEGQILAALGTYVDEAGAALVSSITNTVGGVGQDISESLVATAIAKMANSAKEYFNPGETMAYLCVWPLQIDNVITQPNWSNAEVRGDGNSSIASGWVWKAFGVELMQSGNIHNAGAVAYNLLHVKGSHVLGWWEKMHLLEPQKYGLETLVHATGEFGVAELDEDLACQIQTTDA
jgi:predicted small secreted protein